MFSKRLRSSGHLSWVMKPFVIPGVESPWASMKSALVPSDSRLGDCCVER